MSASVMLRCKINRPRLAIPCLSCSRPVGRRRRQRQEPRGVEEAGWLAIMLSGHRLHNSLFGSLATPSESAQGPELTECADLTVETVSNLGGEQNQ
jgi:hypothetical protein